MSNIIGKLELIKERWEEIGKKIIDPDIISDMKQYVKLTKEYSDLEEVVKALDKLKSLNSNIESNRGIIKTETDADFIEMAKEELSDCESQLDALNEEIKLLLIPKDPEDGKNVVVEIRAGAGGDEASIFAGDLYRMYTKYASTKKWQVDVVDTADGTNGGYKEIIFEISGANVYGEMKYESGVHRVQRVPQTETQGRVHTSAASVIVLPEAEEFDIEIKKADLRVDSYCSSGPGGQSVNTTYSAIRLTHLPTGGYKEIIFEISGANVYGEMKYESGVHRVQRVPQTETQGRVHTSAASVIVLPEAEEFDIEIKKADLRVDSYCSSGPGGQSVNTTYSAIRLTHLPTGVVAQCQDQKSKLKNYDKALSVLRSRVYEIELQKKLANDASTRKSLVSSSDRSAKIRTYNYPQGRVTDHRINLTLYSLSNIIDGDIAEISEALKMAVMAEKMQEGADN